jgi:hypothetical protein
VREEEVAPRQGNVSGELDAGSSKSNLPAFSRQGAFESNKAPVFLSEHPWNMTLTTNISRKRQSPLPQYSLQLVHGPIDLFRSSAHSESCPEAFPTESIIWGAPCMIAFLLPSTRCTSSGALITDSFSCTSRFPSFASSQENEIRVCCGEHED